MVAVCNQGGAEPVIRQLGPEWVVAAIDHGMHAVAQMRGDSRPGMNGHGNLVWAGVGVPKRHMHARGDHM